MDEEAIVKLVLAHGVRNTNLSMFSDEQQRRIMERVAEHLVRLGKMDDLIYLLEHIDPKRFEDIMRAKAEQLVGIAEYQKAALIYEKIGHQDMAKTIRENFL